MDRSLLRRSFVAHGGVAVVQRRLNNVRRKHLVTATMGNIRPNSTKSVVAIAAIFLAIAPAEEARSEPQLNTECRDAAGYRVDGTGVFYEDIDPPITIAKCRAALRQNLQNPTLKAYLARALEKNGDQNAIKEALNLSIEAAHAGDPEGTTRLAVLPGRSRC